MDLESQINAVRDEFARIQTEIRKKIVGNEEIVEGLDNRRLAQAGRPFQ